MDNVVARSREIIRKGSKSFAAAARLFDNGTRDDVHMLYAWCRYCDDLIDGQELGFGREEISRQESRARLDSLRTRTIDALSGIATTDHTFAGLQQVAAKHRIPRRYPLELIEGFAMDVAEFQYRKLEDTLLYAYHVAGVVGVMMSYVMGAKDPAVLNRAADLGIAFQLTNISRDVMDDARNGRVYLPQDWLLEAGVRPEDVAQPEHREAVHQVVRRLLEVADRYYLSANQGLRALGFRAGWAVSTASGVYRDIGSLVLEQGKNAWDQRVVVPGSSKLLWSIRGMFIALAAVGIDRRRTAPPRAADLWIKPDLC